jgi:hypothetical protein
MNEFGFSEYYSNKIKLRNSENRKFQKSPELSWTIWAEVMSSQILGDVTFCEQVEECIVLSVVAY